MASKAFDTCHIPTLMQKLSDFGVGGAILRVFASMYTGVHARLSVNAVLGRIFKVSNGVTQACVLSLLFFTIYIDDLLQNFRESGVGIPMGSFLLKTVSFAGDLLLLSPDNKTTRTLIRILEEWCQKNKLSSPSTFESPRSFSAESY